MKRLLSMIRRGPLGFFLTRSCTLAYDPLLLQVCPLHLACGSFPLEASYKLTLSSEKTSQLAEIAVKAKLMALDYVLAK